MVKLMRAHEFSSKEVDILATQGCVHALWYRASDPSTRTLLDTCYPALVLQSAAVEIEPLAARHIHSGVYWKGHLLHNGAGAEQDCLVGASPAHLRALPSCEKEKEHSRAALTAVEQPPRNIQGA